MSETRTGAGQSLIVEAGGIDYIDESHRHGHARSQFSIRFSPVIYLAPIILGGAAIPLGLGLVGSVTAIALANLLGSIAAGLCAGMGPRRGMPQLAMSRSSFGYHGNYLPAILSSILFIGYFTVGTIVGAKALAALVDLPYSLIAVVVALISIVLATFGYNLLHVTGRWVTAAGVILLLVVTVLAMVHGVGPEASSSINGANYVHAWLLEFTVIFSFTVSWMLYASDYSRYLPVHTRFTSVFGYASSGLFVGSTWAMVLGAVLVSIRPSGALDGFAAVLPRALLIIVLISLTVTSITHNAVQLYSCSMSSLTWNLPLKRSWTVVATGIIGCILAIVLGGSDFQANFNAFLIVMSYFMLPWLAIRLIDFFWKSRGSQTPVGAFYRSDGPFRGVKWIGMAAFIGGIGVSTPFMSSTIYSGPVAHMLDGADVSYFVSFVVAAIIYSFASRPVFRETESGAVVDR